MTTMPLPDSGGFLLPETRLFPQNPENDSKVVFLSNPDAVIVDLTGAGSGNVSDYRGTGGVSETG